MLKIATSFGRSGFQDWLFQRISAVVLAAYTIFLFSYWLLDANKSPLMWQTLFSCELVKYFSLLALLSLCVHSWIGIWTVSTDYLKNKYLRLITQTIVVIALLFYFVWGIQILWP